LQTSISDLVFGVFYYHIQRDVKENGTYDIIVELGSADVAFALLSKLSQVFSEGIEAPPWTWDPVGQRFCQISALDCAP
jgi:hypothetical protein